MIISGLKAMSKVVLYYVHDPMCAWCWSFRPTWNEIQHRLPEDIQVRYVLGGLAPDSDAPMSDEMREKLQVVWHKLQTELAAPFNFEYWTRCKPRRSTYPACRAVIAADNQGRGKDMIYAIQRAYYLRAINPSDTATHLQLAEELGLDVARFAQDLKSDATQQELMRQIALGQKLDAHGFPSLVLEVNGKSCYFQHDYLDADVTLKKIEEVRGSLEQ